MKISEKEEQKNVEYQDTLKINVKFLTKALRQHADQYMRLFEDV